MMDVKKVKLLGYGTTTSFLLIHIAMYFLFRYYGVTPMANFNLFSITFYISTTVMLKREMLWLYSVTVYLEVVLHMSLAVIFVGADSGFQVSLIGMNALGFYVEYLSGRVHSRHVSGVILCSIGMVMYIASYIFSQLFTPAYLLPHQISFWLQIGWGLIVFGVNMVFLKIFVTLINRSERVLSDARTQANSMITALSSDYRSVYYVNLDTNTGICYRADQSDKEQTPEDVEFPFYERFTWYCQHSVAESYREGFMSFIDPQSIRNSLATKPLIAYRYLAKRAGREYYEMIRMAGVRRVEDRDDHIVHSIGLGMTVIDEEMRETMAKNEALANALAQAEEANRAKTAFLSSMSHEIRTPMNAIIGLDNIALHDPNISQNTRDELEKIGSSARHLLSLINDILDMSRIESGRMVLKSEEFSFHEMTEQIKTIINGQCEDKGLIFECSTIGSTDEYFIGDDLRLKQVIINVLGNAVKFTDSPGTVTFTVEQMDYTDEERILRFTMKDTGIGIDEAFLPKLFEPFSQEDATTTNRYGGSGLGMAITKRMVDLMGGNITVETKKGFGSTFTVDVPLKRANHVDEAEDQSEDVVSVAGLHVLMAEDVELNAEVLEDLLDMEDITSEWAENGEIAVKMFADSEPGHFDAILMDMRMPVMDGLTATREIRKLDREDAKTIPIIALTANAFEEDVRQCLQAGMNAHLSKPVDIDKLTRLLGKILIDS